MISRMFPVWCFMYALEIDKHMVNYHYLLLTVLWTLQKSTVIQGSKPNIWNWKNLVIVLCILNIGVSLDFTIINIGSLVEKKNSDCSFIYSCLHLNEELFNSIIKVLSTAGICFA